MTLPCADCRHPVEQRPDGRWMHRIPRPADPASRVIDPVASAEYGRELGLWTLRTGTHSAEPDITFLTVRGCSCVDGCSRCGGTGRLDG